MSDIEETRLTIIKTMLKEYPELREKVVKWLQETSVQEDSKG